MPPKLTKKVIQERIFSEGYVCTGYDVVTKKFDYVCNKGHNGSTRVDHWNNGVRCSVCAGNKKLSIGFVKREFSKEGYTVLSDKYVNSKVPLKVMCSKGHIYFVKYGNWRSGYRCQKCHYKKIRGKNNPYITSGAADRYDSKDHYNWKGGVAKKGLPLYKTYSTRLKPYHNIKSKIQDGLELINVECVYCGSFYTPTVIAVTNRLYMINGMRTGHGEQNFYCSDNCKKTCPTFNQKKYPRGFKKATSREVQPALRKLVLRRDNYKCQICEATIKEVELHCHHLTGVEHNPIESADLDNCIILCKKHHKQVHSLPGCGYNELKCDK